VPSFSSPNSDLPLGVAGFVCETATMSWLERWDRRNQRIAERQMRSGVPPDDPIEDNPAVAAGSLASCLPGLAGVLGILVAAIAAWRLRRKRE
jgi:hypothetical protein